MALALVGARSSPLPRRCRSSSDRSSSASPWRRPSQPGLGALERRGMDPRQAAAIVAVILWASIVVVTVLSAAALVNDAGAATGTSTAIPDDGRAGSDARSRSSRHTSAVSSRRSTSVFAQLFGFAFFLILTALAVVLLPGRRRASVEPPRRSRLSAWRRREVQIAGERGVIDPRRLHDRDRCPGRVQRDHRLGDHDAARAAAGAARSRSCRSSAGSSRTSARPRRACWRSSSR